MRQHCRLRRTGGGAGALLRGGRADVELLVLDEPELQAASSSEPAATRPSTAWVFRRMNISLSDGTGGRVGQRQYQLEYGTRTAGFTRPHLDDTH